MNSELINTVEETRSKIRAAVDMLRKTAAPESVIVKEASAETASKGLDPERVREVFEEMVAANLAKAAEIEPAVEKACSDPNVLLDAMRKLTLRAAASQTEPAKQETAPRRPGQLVNKTASAFPKETAVQRMKRLCEEKRRELPT